MEKNSSLQNKNTKIRLRCLSCYKCLKIGRAFKCTHCSSLPAYYCGKPCQEKHWKSHKHVCEMFSKNHQRITRQSENIGNVLTGGLDTGLGPVEEVREDNPFNGPKMEKFKEQIQDLEEAQTSQQIIREEIQSLKEQIEKNTQEIKESEKLLETGESPGMGIGQEADVTKKLTMEQIKQKIDSLKTDVEKLKEKSLEKEKELAGQTKIVKELEEKVNSDPLSKVRNYVKDMVRIFSYYKDRTESLQKIEDELFENEKKFSVDTFPVEDIQSTEEDINMVLGWTESSIEEEKVFREDGIGVLPIIDKMVKLARESVEKGHGMNLIDKSIFEPVLDQIISFKEEQDEFARSPNLSLMKKLQRDQFVLIANLLDLGKKSGVLSEETPDYGSLTIGRLKADMDISNLIFSMEIDNAVYLGPTSMRQKTSDIVSELKQILSKDESDLEKKLDIESDRDKKKALVDEVVDVQSAIKAVDEYVKWTTDIFDNDIVPKEEKEIEESIGREETQTKLSELTEKLQEQEKLQQQTVEKITKGEKVKVKPPVTGIPSTPGAAPVASDLGEMFSEFSTEKKQKQKKIGVRRSRRVANENDDSSDNNDSESDDESSESDDEASENNSEPGKEKEKDTDLEDRFIEETTKVLNGYPYNSTRESLDVLSRLLETSLNFQTVEEEPVVLELLGALKTASKTLQSLSDEQIRAGLKPQGGTFMKHILENIKGINGGQAKLRKTLKNRNNRAVEFATNNWTKTLLLAAVLASSGRLAAGEETVQEFNNFADAPRIFNEVELGLSPESAILTKQRLALHIESPVQNMEYLNASESVGTSVDEFAKETGDESLEEKIRRALEEFDKQEFVRLETDRREMSKQHPESFMDNTGSQSERHVIDLIVQFPNIDNPFGQANIMGSHESIKSIMTNKHFIAMRTRQTEFDDNSPFLEMTRLLQSTMTISLMRPDWFNGAESQLKRAVSEFERSDEEAVTSAALGEISAAAMRIELGRASNKAKRLQNVEALLDPILSEQDKKSNDVLETIGLSLRPSITRLSNLSRDLTNERSQSEKEIDKERISDLEKEVDDQRNATIRILKDFVKQLDDNEEFFTKKRNIDVANLTKTIDGTIKFFQQQTENPDNALSAEELEFFISRIDQLPSPGDIEEGQKLRSREHLKLDAARFRTWVQNLHNIYIDFTKESKSLFGVLATERLKDFAQRLETAVGHDNHEQLIGMKSNADEKERENFIRQKVVEIMSNFEGEMANWKLSLIKLYGDVLPKTIDHLDEVFFKQRRLTGRELEEVGASITLFKNLETWIINRRTQNINDLVFWKSAGTETDNDAVISTSIALLEKRLEREQEDSEKRQSLQNLLSSSKEVFNQVKTSNQLFAYLSIFLTFLLPSGAVSPSKLLNIWSGHRIQIIRDMYKSFDEIESQLDAALNHYLSIAPSIERRQGRVDELGNPDDTLSKGIISSVAVARDDINRRKLRILQFYDIGFENTFLFGMVDASNKTRGRRSVVTEVSRTVRLTASGLLAFIGVSHMFYTVNISENIMGKLLRPYTLYPALGVAASSTWALMNSVDLLSAKTSQAKLTSRDLTADDMKIKNIMIGTRNQAVLKAVGVLTIDGITSVGVHLAMETFTDTNPWIFTSLVWFWWAISYTSVIWEASKIRSVLKFQK